jgi:exopolyphosphatase/guanosine-5'-triphosphate,3'-diphosphate pyrophosphatase
MRCSLGRNEKWIKVNKAIMKKLPILEVILINYLKCQVQGKKSLYLIYMTSQYSFLNSLTPTNKIAELGLNPDRADVIIPATRIYLNAMKWSGARQIYVPKIGLSDGIVKAMYYGNI